MLKLLNLFINNLLAFAYLVVFISVLYANSTGIDTYTENFEQFKADIEDKYAAFPKEETEGRFFGIFEKYIKATNRSTVNYIVMLNDGRAVFSSVSNPPHLYDRADEIIRLSGYLSGKDTPFLFIRVPKGMKDNSDLPLILRDRTTVIEDMDRFLTRLQDNDVDILDMRASMNFDNISYSEFYFRNDHHWNTSGALYCFGKLGRLLNAEHGYDIDAMLWNPESFDSVTYADAFIGSLSQRLGNTREDITVLLPKTHTDITVFRIDPLDRANHMEELASGSFIDVFTPKVKNGHNDDFRFADLNRYRNGFFRYVNSAAQTGKKILLVGDSFGTVLATYLSTAVKSVDYLYISDNNNPKLYPMLESEEYDIVLFILCEDLLIRDEDGIGLEDRLQLGGFDD